MAKTLFLGVEGSGKTTLAMALTKAFARHGGAGWYLRPQDRGAYNFATVAPEDFARDGFPRQTANVREMTWRIERRGEDLGELEILDYPGEVYRLAFLEADDEPDPVAFRERAEASGKEIATLRAALAEAGRVFVLFNLQDALDLRRNDANRSAVWVTNESLKAVKALPSKPHVTLVFTQVDRYQTDDDFLHSFTPRDLDLVGHDHPDVDWTMVSVMVPPESEFGIDAFVRRCTGLDAFGVPDGRPVDSSVAGRGASLRRLGVALGGGQVARKAEPVPSASVPPVSVPPASVPPASALSASAPVGTADPCGPRPPAVRSRTGCLLGALVLSVAAALVSFAVGDALHVRARRRLTAREKTVRAEAGRVKRLADETAAHERAAAAKAAEEKIRAERAAAEQARAEKAAAEKVAAEKAAAEKAAAEEEVRTRRRATWSARARRLGAAAWDAWQAAAEETASRRAAAEAGLAKALAADSPQDAHDALCDAAEAGSAAAQERLARVYDVWGWGGWVRTKEEAGARWTDWLRRIDFGQGGRAFLVSRPAPNAEEFRRLALDWYRAAAGNGDAAAAEALRLHGETPPAPETVAAARAMAEEAEAAK